MTDDLFAFDNDKENQDSTLAEELSSFEVEALESRVLLSATCLNFGIVPDGDLDPIPECPEPHPDPDIDPNGDPFDPVPPEDEPDEPRPADPPPADPPKDEEPPVEDPPPADPPVEDPPPEEPPAEDPPPVDPPAEEPPAEEPDEDCDEDGDGEPEPPTVVQVETNLSTPSDTPVTTESIHELGELVSFIQPENGRLIFNADCTFTYTPDTGFVGTDCFSYTLECDNGTLTTYVHHVDVHECDEPEPELLPPPPIVPQVEYKTDYEDGGDEGGLHWGDPHFVGDDGGKYDIQGEPGGIYNMLSDRDLQYNARFASWGNAAATVVDAVGVTASDNQIGWAVGENPTLNGQRLQHGETLVFEGGCVSWQGNNVVVWTESYELTFKNNGGHINGDYVATNPFADEVGAHGLWGQTVDAGTEQVRGDLGAGAQGGGAIETIDADGNVVLSERGDTEAVELYRVEDLFALEGSNDNTFFYYGAERGTGLEACEPMEVVPEPEPEPNWDPPIIEDPAPPEPEPAPPLPDPVPPLPDPVPEPIWDPPIIEDPAPPEPEPAPPLPDPVPIDPEPEIAAVPPNAPVAPEPPADEEECEEEHEEPPEPEVEYDTTYTDGSDEGGKHWGDPHFVGDDGGQYDVQGVPGRIYNMISDHNLQYNAKFIDYGNGATVVGEVGVVVGDHQIGWTAGGVPTLNGVELQPGDEVQLDDIELEWVGNELKVDTDEYEMTFLQRGNPNTLQYFDGEYVAKDPFKDDVGAHGLWGQTVDGDSDAINGDRGRGAQGGGAIETVDDEGNIVTSERGDKQAVELYEVNDIYDTVGTNSNEFFYFDAERGTGLDVKQD